jgi:hypothetical protein
MKMSSEEISKHKKYLHELISEIKRHAFFSAYPDSLVHGVACKAYRRCGQKNCKCKDADKRHGPYLIIQLYENSKQKQVCLRQSEKELWDMAANYQKNIASALKLKKACNELCKEVNQIIKKRVQKLERLRCKEK